MPKPVQRLSWAYETDESRVEPKYTEVARQAKLQGVAVLSAIVHKDGRIETVNIVRALGLGLDENAVQALSQWKFHPGTKNGVPVDVVLNVEVNFSLEQNWR